MIGAIGRIASGARNFHQFIDVANKRSVLKIGFLDGDTAHRLFDKIDEGFRFGVMTPRTVAERNSGLKNFRKGTVADLSDDRIGSVD